MSSILFSIKLSDYAPDLPADFDPELDNAESEILIYLNKYKENLEFYKTLKRGDVVYLSEFDSYRNDGKFLYAGNQFILLDTSFDEYGAIPTSFVSIEEFPLFYWNDVIIHNCIFHIRNTHLEYKEKKRVKELNEVNYFYSFSYGDKTYTIRSYSRLDLENDAIITLDDDAEDISDFFVLTKRYY